MRAEEPGRIVTFYSYKGGTGRSMALANFAWILAAAGKGVLTVDWDLEAPGLHRYFRPFLIDPDLFETEGLIDTFWSLAATALQNAQTTEPSNEGAALDQTKRRLNWKFATGGYIDLVGAGRQGATYSERVNTFDWKRFYELGGANVLASAKADLKTKYDWVLIDSRTGVSDTSGICTMQLPDMVVACFTMNRQSIDGVDAIMRSIRSFRSSTVDGSKITLFPMATRIENAEKERLEIARTYAREKLSEFVPAQLSSSGHAYWDDMEVSYRPYYAFEEILSAFGDSTGATRAMDSMLAQTEAMAQFVANDKNLRMPEVLEVDRQKILTRYSLGRNVILASRIPAGPKDGDNSHVLDDSSSDTAFLRGLLAKEQLWRTHNFEPELLLSRREIDLISEDDRKQFGRNMTYYFLNSTRGQQYFGYLVIAFVLNIAVSGLAGASVFSWLTSQKQFFEFPTFLLANYAMLAAIMIWILLAVLESLVLPSFGPNGVRFSNTLFRLLTGRVAAPAIDYRSEQK